MPNLAIVFDFDGVVLDTETPLYTSWEEMYTRHGVHLDIEQFATYIGGADYFDFHANLEQQALHVHEAETKGKRWEQKSPTLSCLLVSMPTISTSLLYSC